MQTLKRLKQIAAEYDPENPCPTDAKYMHKYLCEFIEKEMTTPNVFEHYTYNMTFALVAFEEKFAVYCCHPDDDNVRLWSPKDIEDCEGHLFLITEHKKKNQ